jgi:hypothetical protein
MSDRATAVIKAIRLNDQLPEAATAALQVVQAGG